MNSTSNANLSNMEEFFFKELGPLARRLHGKNDSVFFEKRPNPTRHTYFVRRKRVTMGREDFETGGCSSPEDLKKALVSLWMAEGYTELPIIADAIVKLSGLAHHTEEQSSEVSPFIYVMF